jgi:hypothetical protein
MSKRRQTELKATPVNLSVHRWKEISSLRAQAHAKWNIHSIQPFFPTLQLLFKTDQLEFVQEYGLRFDEEIVSIIEPNLIQTSLHNTRPVHLKTSMLLSPFKWMEGEYGVEVGLPTTREQSQIISSKIQNYHNSSYVGSLIAGVLSQSKCQHFPKVYGIFSGFSKSHTINISDDYEDLSERSWFVKNIGKTFQLKLADEIKNNPTTEFNHTRKSKYQLHLGEDTELAGINELETTNTYASIGDIQKIFQNEESEDSENMSDSSSVSTSYIFEVRSADSESEIDEEAEDVDDEDSEQLDDLNEEFAWATFTNVPIQTTIMEKCEDTLFNLLMSDSDTNKHLAWITQVIFALAFAQRNFGFVHNDLHANNVMYVKTDEEFLNYNCNGVFYKVPTYGYLIKIIDFERGLMSIRVQGMKDSKFVMSDHFSISEEAGGQYNYEPFYNPKFPEIKPCPSFDLVRLATSFFWDLFPEGPYHEEYKTNVLFNMFIRWLTKDDGSSLMFGKKDPRVERYQGFMTYKVIARHCRDSAIPRKEAEGLKSIYGVESLPFGATWLNID